MTTELSCVFCGGTDQVEPVELDRWYRYTNQIPDAVACEYLGPFGACRFCLALPDEERRAAMTEHAVHCNKCDCWYLKGPSHQAGDRCGDMTWAEGSWSEWSDGSIHWEYEDGTEPQPCDGTLVRNDDHRKVSIET